MKSYAIEKIRVLRLFCHRAVLVCNLFSPFSVEEFYFIDLMCV